MSTPRTSGARTVRRASNEPGMLADWMERYVGGDRRAFALLFRAIAPRVRRQIRTRIGDDASTDDLLQQTMLRAHAARQRYRRPAENADEALVSWYCAIARNLAHNFVRAKMRTRVAPVDEHLEVVGDVEQETVAHELAIERTAALHAAIEALPPGQRVVVRMHRLEGLPVAEVSRRLGVRNGAVRVRAHRAYEGLRAIMLSSAA
jgi:RNA polymerase sigma-70 factor, ECF subfamily